MDEVVVVDTGSTDRSREIALGFGARLIDFPWVEDFSAPRNVAIEHATSEWLLYIDADERVREIDRAVLDRDLSNKSWLTATVCFRPKSGFTAYREYRLIRRDSRIRFRGVMHESCMGDIRALVRSGEGVIGASSMAIDHVGYDGDQSHKLDRNLNLLLKQIEVAPKRAYLRWHLGCVFRDLGRDEESEASWREGARVVREDSEAPQYTVMCMLELAKLEFLRGGNPSAAIAEGLKVHPGNKMLVWLQGKALLHAGDFAAARPIFEFLADVDADSIVDQVSYDSRIFGSYALQELAEDAFLREDYVKSVAFFARALQRDPQRLELRAKLALASARA